MALTFSIVTPTFNSQNYLWETINSVVTQRGNFYIDYFIVDGGSTDSTIDIIKKFHSLIETNQFPVNCLGVKFGWISGPDIGMYDAINKGFSLAEGDVCAWINSDDIYLPGAFKIVSNIFSQIPSVDWIKGITSYVGPNSEILKLGQCNLYAREFIKHGVYGRSDYFIQQDSVFWSSRLWRMARGCDSTCRLAGDYHLWKRFANFSSLVSVNAYFSCFRQVDGQLSSNIVEYTNEMKGVSEVESCIDRKVIFYQRLERWLPHFLCVVVHKFVFWKLRYVAVLSKNGFDFKLVVGSYHYVKSALSK